jgi:hypothetical protein
LQIDNALELLSLNRIKLAAGSLPSVPRPIQLGPACYSSSSSRDADIAKGETIVAVEVGDAG